VRLDSSEFGVHNLLCESSTTKVGPKVNPKRRRLGFVLSGTIAVLAVTVASLPLLQSGVDSPVGPAIVPRPIVIALLLALPAGLAAIAAFRGSRPLFLAAGVLCLLQSVVAFSGVTLGFVIPGILLVGLGLERTGSNPGRAWIAAAFAVGLGMAAWVAPFATSETVCWIASQGPDGSLLYRRVPESDTVTLGLGDVAGGCDGGSFTLEGLLLAGTFAVGALAIAGLGAGSGDASDLGDAQPSAQAGT
jgi:hypothetical protein